MQAGQTIKTCAKCIYLALAPARRIKLSDRIFNEHLFINCTSVQAEGPINSPPA